MGLLFNDPNEINEKVFERFGDKDSYLIAMKHNDAKTGLLKLLVSKLYYTFDSARTFVLHFSPKGIYEVEISNTLKKDFLLMPWNEISSFESKTTPSKTIINLVHLGKKVSYEVPFEGKFFTCNRHNFDWLEERSWNKVL